MKGYLPALNMATRFDRIVNRQENRFVSCFNVFFSHEEKEYRRFALVPNNVTLYGGSFVTVTPFESARDLVKSAFEELRADRPNAQRVYSSREDGPEREGLRLEQHVQQGVYSTFLKSYDTVLRFGENGYAIGEQQGLIHQSDCQIVLDEKDRKLYVGGRKSSSQNIQSQSMAVELLSLLLDRQGERVANSELPPSSYAKNKGDLLNKVLNPLKKLVLKRLGKELPLRCEGKTHEFKLLLEPSELSIGRVVGLRR